MDKLRNLFSNRISQIIYKIKKKKPTRLPNPIGNKNTHFKHNN